MPSPRAVRILLACSFAAAIPLAFAASFNVTGNDTAAKTLAPASGGTETGTVAAAGDLNVSGGTVAVTITGGSGTRTATIDNSGKIRQTGTTRAIRNSSGVATIGITNRAGATISSVGDDSIQVSAPGSSFTLDNSGTITTGTGRAVNLRDIGGANTINNLAGGTLRSTAGDAVRPGVNGNINNAGLIQAVTRLKTTGSVTEAESDDGIQADITGGAPVNGVTVTNSGTISGRHGITGSAGTSANFSITVNNQAAGTITGVNGSGLNIDNNGSFLGNASVTNNGTITGNFDSALYNTGDGDGVDVDGVVTLVNNGIIRSRGAGGAGSDTFSNNPEGLAIGGGSVTNNANAEITGEDTALNGAKGRGILVDNSSRGDAFAATTVTNAGLIRGYSSFGIRFIGNFADTISNEAGGIIRGDGVIGEGAAIQMGDGNDTLTNRGSILGDNGLAVDLEAGNDVLHILGSAAITGDVSGGAGSNTLDFDVGSFSYGGALSNFASVEIKGGTVTLAGASTYTGDTTVTAGRLLATNTTGRATGSGTVIVKSGATLGGSGTVGAVSAESGSSIAPGTSPGTLTVSALAISSGSKFQFELGAVSDRLTVTGALDFSGSGAAVIDIIDAGLSAGTDYTLISFASSSNFSTANVVLGTLPSGLEATLEVTSNAVILRTAAQINVSPASLDFGSKVIGTSSAEQTVTVSNPGTITLTVGTPTLSGMEAGDYSIGSNTCTSGLAAGASCTIAVSFTPTSSGSRSASLDIPSNAAGSPSVVALSGTGVAANYSLQAAPASTDFGNQPVGSTSGTRTVTVSNNGNVAISVSGFSSGGANPTDFAVAGNGCAGLTLAVGESCTATFTFTPAASGSRSATETVTSSPAQSGTPASFTLSGTGTQATVSLNPATLAFGNQPLGTSSLVQTVTLMNAGNSALSITSIAASGDFSQTNNCGTLLAAAASCAIDLRFAPTATGPRTGTLTLMSSAASSPDSVSLGGTGTQAALSVSGSTGFGTRTVGSASAPQSLTITNSGTATLMVGTPSFSGSYAADYAIASNTCTSGIAPTMSCAIGITFTPVAAGTRNASLLIPSNAPGSPLSVPVTGSGLAAGAKPGKLGLATASLSAKEGNGSMVFRVNRMGGSDGAVTVDYASGNGTALAGQDYTAATGTLSWAAGDAAAKLVTVTLNDDFVVEDKETFTLTLGNPSGGAILSRSLSTGSIVSDDKPGTLSFSSSAVTVNENAGTVTVTVRRTAGVGDAVGVHYATSDNTALAGSDYGSTAGDLSWAAGDAASKSFTVPIVWDTAAERTEYFNVLLSLPTGGAKLGSQKMQRVNIVNVKH